jgi:transposase
VLQKHQERLVEYALVSDKQMVDFSSTFFEGKAEDAGEYGYSRDNQPNKKQITFGICTGINGIPLALTVQKGNVQDKAHFRFMLRAVEAVMPEGTLLIFDCGANTKTNKEAIREKGHHYLTLKAKKIGPYKIAITYFSESKNEEFEINGQKYKCVKRKKGEETEYIYFSQDLFADQIKAKERKYEREKSRNASLLKKAKNGKPIGQYYCDEGVVIAKGIFQSTLFEFNPYFNGIEGFFILESTVDASPSHILSLYKDRDKAEKLIQNFKEGTEIRPVRHWNKSMITGYILLIFLTNFLVQLTHLRTQSSISTNIKRLKKNINKLTVTVVYPENRFKFQVLSNETEEIRSFLGDSIDRFRDESYNFRW